MSNEVSNEDNEDFFSYYEEGIDAYYSGKRNPYQEDSYAWKEFERGWKAENRRELILDDRD